MRLTFWGAAQQVTGSMFLLELEDDYKILIDCGLDMDRHRKREEKNAPPASHRLFPFEASQINILLLTHAHLDHSGNIPNLFKEGFEGQIVCTSATSALSDILLSDSASLNYRKLKKYSNPKKRKAKDKYPVNQTDELYLQKQVDEALENFFPLNFLQRFRLKQGVYVTFIPTGHLLGAANVLIEAQEGDQKKSILFSGDIGRANYPLLQDPHTVPQVDYVVCESTYGARLHTADSSPEEEILRIVKEACVDMPGRLIIPAFSVGRTQALLYTLHKLAAAGKLPAIKIFSDSPLAFKSTKIYNKFIQQLNEEAQAFYKEHHTLFDFDNLIYVENMRESKAISNHKEPCIIISASGMVQGGRIEEHIKANISNPYATILMIGYATEGTLGYDLLHGKKMLKIARRQLEVAANIRSTDVFSGHGDQNDLLKFMHYQSPEKLKKTFIVHGEVSSMQIFQAKLHELGYKNVEIPAKGASFEL